MSKINTFHVSLFAEFLGKLKATKEGNGTCSTIRSIFTAAALEIEHP